MSGRLLFSICILFSLLASCARVQVSQDYDPSYTFNTERIYGWNEELQKKDGGLLVKDDLLRKRFIDDINTILAQNGYQQDKQPGILVSCSFTVTSKFQSEPFNSGIRFGYGTYSRHGGIGFGSGSSLRQYNEGKLTINFHARQSGLLVWKGTGTMEVSTHAKPEQVSRDVNAMVTAVLEQMFTQ